MTFEEYLFKVYAERAKQRLWRLGTCYYVVLMEVKPKLAREIWDRPENPYYDDSTISPFLAVVEKCWGIER